MAPKYKLKSALQKHKGISPLLEKQKKLRKLAERRERAANPDAPADAVVGEDQQDDEDADVSDPESAPALVSTSTAQAPTRNIETSLENGGLPTPPDEDDEPVQPTQAVEENDGEDEDESDIPLSDLESLASEDREDLIPRQRLTINNHAALARALQALKPLPRQPFSEHLSVLSDVPTADSIPDPDDDLPRELAFYKQCLSASVEARRQFRKEKIPFLRPPDYFAEMLKSDEHMGKVRGKLTGEASRRRASQEARKLRDAKKFGKAVQVAKQQERAKEKRVTLDKIKVMKRKRAGAGVSEANEEDMFDVGLEKETRGSGRGGSEDGERAGKRRKKDEKFGFGGKKRFRKSNDAISTGDMSKFSRAKNGSARTKPKGSARRLGKSRRAK